MLSSPIEDDELKEGASGEAGEEAAATERERKESRWIDASKLFFFASPQRRGRRIVQRCSCRGGGSACIALVIVISEAEAMVRERGKGGVARLSW